MYFKAFSLIETLFCLIIISLLSIFMIKPYSMESIATRQASFHIQMIQKNINDITYKAFLNKQIVDLYLLRKILENSQTNNKYFTLTLQQQDYILKIGKKKLKLSIKKNINNSYIITCNPIYSLCRKLYHRKNKK